MTEEAGNNFYKLVREVIESEAYQRMKTYKHHLNGNTYEHSVKVAYLCYRYCQTHQTKIDLCEVVRAALLHDYFLYDRHKDVDGKHINGLLHGFTHSKVALKNAIRDYPELSDTERDAIKRHMFPLTPIPPKTRCGWLICYYDKIAAIGDYFHKTAWKKTPALRFVFDVP